MKAIVYHSRADQHKNRVSQSEKKLQPLGFSSFEHFDEEEVSPARTYPGLLVAIDHMKDDDTLVVPKVRHLCNSPYFLSMFIGISFLFIDRPETPENLAAAIEAAKRYSSTLKIPKGMRKPILPGAHDEFLAAGRVARAVNSLETRKVSFGPFMAAIRALREAKRGWPAIANYLNAQGLRNEWGEPFGQQVAKKYFTSLEEIGL